MTSEYGSAVEMQAVSGTDARRREVDLLARLHASVTDGDSLLGFASKVGIPDSTLRYWLSRMNQTTAPPSLVRFVESREGLEIVHRIVLAAQYVITQEVGGGVRAVCAFLKLSGLAEVVAAGYGTQQLAIKAMEEETIEFGEEQRSLMAARMAPREISVARDETFHEQPCLVAMEPVSNFILVEQYATDRRAETWAEAMRQGLDGLPVTVIQSTSDEGAALLRTAQESGIHHSPDLFHPHQDISRATSLPLQRAVAAAEQKAAEAAQHLTATLDEAEYYDRMPHGPGRPPAFEQRSAKAEAALAAAEQALEQAKARRQEVRDEARGISLAYHPFDIASGELRDAAQVESDLQARMDRIEALAEEVGINARCRGLLEKARRLLPKMIGTIAFVHTLIQQKVEKLDLPTAVEAFVMQRLIPFYYLGECLRKTATAEGRAALRGRIESLRAIIEDSGCPLLMVSPELQAHIHRVALECSRIFQRSSSGVEGHNGVLELRHHSLHELNPRKLQALTAVHNFGTYRADGTTAAERFFGQKHRPLFDHLAAKLPAPKRPAMARAA